MYQQHNTLNWPESRTVCIALSFACEVILFLHMHFRNVLSEQPTPHLNMQHLPAFRIACFTHGISKHHLRRRQPNGADKLRNDLHEAACFAHASMLTLDSHLFLAHQYNTHCHSNASDIGSPLPVYRSLMQSQVVTRQACLHSNRQLLSRQKVVMAVKITSRCV